MSAPTDHKPAILFDDFEPGRLLGSHTLVYDEALAKNWRRIFQDTEGCTYSQAEAASIATLLMMRAYLAVVSPRPPGNIHARQSMVFATLPTIGDELDITIECRAKEVKRGRRYVELLALGKASDGPPIFQGVLTLIWAA